MPELREGAFSRRLAAASARCGTLALLELRPTIPMMPLPIARFDDPFLPFGKAVINVTHPFVCGYVFDLAAYFALGAAGIVALERSIAYARGFEAVVAILHVPFASGAYAIACGPLALNVDAVTVTPECDDAAFLASGVHPLHVQDTETGFPGLMTDSRTYTLIRPEDYRAAVGDDFEPVLRDIVRQMAQQSA
ncbi:MAG: hypothetical protein KME04_02435 [Pleurocapsa minor GSE-CHR-MK-17-07R]|jgi:hypothetical protein|nr:hypothetical protein [Pleurocapsa minor GSE-CHR-MK 17-07R]